MSIPKWIEQWIQKEDDELDYKPKDTTGRDLPPEEHFRWDIPFDIGASLGEDYQRRKAQVREEYCLEMLRYEQGLLDSIGE